MKIYATKDDFFNYSSLCIPGEAMDLWKTIRGNYRRAVIKIAKWQKPPSGSGLQAGKRPRTYKHAAELSFLDAVFDLEETIDSMSSQLNKEQENSESDEQEMKQVLLHSYTHKSCPAQSYGRFGTIRRPTSASTYVDGRHRNTFFEVKAKI
jgi:hypothetical protein